MALTLPVHTWGTGPLQVLFLHGFTGSRHSFDHLEPLLGAAFTATCLELPGHGEAAVPQGDARHAFREVIAAIAEHAERHDLVIGYSQGARLALAVAAMHPECVKGLVLESGTPGLHRRHDRWHRRVDDEFLAQSIVKDGVERFVEKWEKSPLFSGLRQASARDQSLLRARRVSHSAQGLAAALRSMGQGVQPDFWPILPRIFTPTLLISGQYDLKFSRIAGRMKVEMPRAWHARIPASGHAVHLERPELWAGEVLSFSQALQQTRTEAVAST